MTIALERLIQAAEARAALAQRGAQAAIDALALAAFAKFWGFLVEHPEASPRDAIQAAQVEFGGGFADALAEAFSELLQRSVSTTEIRAMPVGDLSLSRRLYLHTVQTASEVVGLIREHGKGIQQARELSLRLYDGYDPQDGIQRPLEGRARALLPKALRSLTDDLPTRRTLTMLQVQGQEQAARLKSQALRAAYTEAFDAWKAGKGMDALKRKLEIAQREKNRFIADRIAQTELHRAHQAQVARELMDDDLTTVVQVKINPTHPRTDICDLHARADLWGLGPGCYPKPEAPRPPFHPFCRCKLKSRPSLNASMATRSPAGAAGYLRTLSDDQAARVMGSAERAARVLHGEPAELVINAGKDPLYRLVRVGDARAQEHALLKPDEETT